MYLWEIWYDDVFLGFQSAYDADDAVRRAYAYGGIACNCGAEINDIEARYRLCGLKIL